MFIYTENDTEFDKRIKNNNLEYKTHQKYTNSFQRNPKKNEMYQKSQKIQKIYIRSP